MAQKTFNFLPFVGKNYPQAQPKILILGASHYGLDEGIYKTKNVVERFLNGASYRFLSGVLKALYGEEWNRDDINNLSFYNYVQELMQNSSCRPSDNQWDASKMLFQEALRMLYPDIVLCCGKSLHNHLTDNMDTAQQQKGICISNASYLWCKQYNYRAAGKEIKLLAMSHPSSRGFNGLNYYNVMFGSIYGGRGDQKR